MLEVNNLSKLFGKKVALDGVTFSIGRGEIVGLVGPNGSGKTTLLNILMGMIRPSSGSFSIIEEVRIGMSVSRRGFFEDMTVKENLSMYCKLQDTLESQMIKAINDLSVDFGEMRYGTLSAGMKQRVSLIMSFVRKNDLVLLDEPSNHLDIDSILKLRSLILRENELNSSFLITSHIFSDLEKICHRILFLKNGKLFETLSKIGLMEKYGNLENAYLEILQADRK